jgi:hypothetical protein
MTAGPTLKLFNYLFLYFQADRDSLKESSRSSILQELDNHVRDNQFDFSQNELVKTSELAGDCTTSSSTSEPDKNIPHCENKQ